MTGTNGPPNTPCEPIFLRDGDFAVIVTPARGVPTATSQPDEIVVQQLALRQILVDTEAGIVCRADGTRAETPQPAGFGRVYLGRIWGRVRYATAHRVVWLAKHGPIPGNYRVIHVNGRSWDNRIANLALATAAEARRHAAGTGYAGPPPAELPDDRPASRPHTTAADGHKPSRARRRNLA